jgi:hypothetical protein
MRFTSLTRVSGTLYLLWDIPSGYEGMASLTASDIARRIQRPGEDLQVAIDRLRHWTKAGLIKPVGDAHPGTGRPKQYSKKAAVRAMIVQALSDATGGQAVYLEFLIDHVEAELRKSKGKRDRIFAISRKGGSGKFDLTTWLAKDFGEAILKSVADVHIVLNPNRILDQFDEAD